MTAQHWKDEFHFDRGRETGKGLAYLVIARNLTWSGTDHEGSLVTSYEQVGVDDGSEAFIRGVFSVGTPVYLGGLPRILVDSAEELFASKNFQETLKRHTLDQKGRIRYPVAC